MAHEGVPLTVIRRQLGHNNLGITSIYLQGIDNAEIIEAVHARRGPMVSVTTADDLAGVHHANQQRSITLAVWQRVRHPLGRGGRPLDVRKADRPAARRSTDLDAVDLNVVALTRTSKDVVERVTSVPERVSPVGDDDRRLKLHAISIARSPGRRDTLGRWRPARAS